MPTGRPVTDDEVTIANYGEELVRLVLHPESKMIGPGGEPCRYTTRGLLRPRPVLVAAVYTVGKEGNRIEEVATGEVTDPDEVLTDYGDDAWEHLVCPVGLLMGIRRVARESQIALSQVADLLHGRAVPRPATRVVLTGRVTAWAASELGPARLRDNHNPTVVLASYLAALSSDPPRRETPKGDWPAAPPR